MPGVPGMTQKRRAGESMRQRAWTAMRIFKTFSVAQIEATAEIERENLRKYLKALHRAGYLVLHRPKRNGQAGGHAVWRLARDSGPTAPHPLHGGAGVYDPNSGAVHPFRDDAHD